MTLLSDMATFAAVVEQESFTLGAKKLNISKSYASKVIAKLEKDIGVKLLYRSTRKLSLTEAGAKFYAHCCQININAQNAIDEVSWHQDKLEGLLRITTPFALTSVVLPNIIQEVQKNHPFLKFDIYATNDFIDIIGKGYDLALRMGKLEPSRLISKKITEISTILCASQNYFTLNNTVNSPFDLINHNMVIYQPGTQSVQTLKFTSGKEEIVAQIAPQVSTNNSWLIKNLLLSGNCIAALPEYMIKDELLDGSLIQVLPDFALPTDTLSAIYPHREYLSKKTKVFIDRLVKYFDTTKSIS